MRATTFCTPNVSRATRAAMMFELSPLLTAAKASASSMPAAISVSAVEAESGDRAGPEVVAEAAERGWILVDDGDGVLEPLQVVGERRADPAAPHDDDVHGAHLLSWSTTSPWRTATSGSQTPASATLHNAGVIRHGPQGSRELRE